MPGAAHTDVLLVGAGIMSATLAAILRRLDPHATITILERLDAPARESSAAFNNAGTGHAGLCELFYTPARPDGTIDVSKAVRVNEQFQLTRQFWAYAVQSGMLADPAGFIHPVPHASFVTGAADIDYLRRRHAALAHNPLFAGTELSTDRSEFAARLPLLAAGRDPGQPVGFSWNDAGVDVDFGALTAGLLDYGTGNGTTLLTGRQVSGLTRGADGRWAVRHVDRRTGAGATLTARFVFLGAGGGTLPLLQRAGIPEARGLGGFPIGGRFLRCESPQIVATHTAKVYGRPAPGAPGTTAPHLDTRIVDGAATLLFGPFPGWSPRFLKHGRRTDLARSIRGDNIAGLARVGLAERRLIGYLLGQLRQRHRDRVAALRRFAPTAADADWTTINAGQRVQVVRSGRLEFDTALITGADGSIAALLGASPGASTAVPIALDVLARCLPDRYRHWRGKLTEMLPSLGVELAGEPALLAEITEWSNRQLLLDRPPGINQ